MNGVAFHCSHCGLSLGLTPLLNLPLKVIERMSVSCANCGKEAMPIIKLACSQCNKPIQILPDWYKLSPLEINERHASCQDTRSCGKRLVGILLAESADAPTPESTPDGRWIMKIILHCSYCFGELPFTEDDQQKTLAELLEEPPRFHGQTCQDCFLDQASKPRQPELPGMEWPTPASREAPRACSGRGFLFLLKTKYPLSFSP